MQLKTEISAGGIVYKNSPDGPLWLITQHSQHKHWGFPKGLVGDTVENEPRENASLREVKEEGGVKATIIDPEPIEVKYKYRVDDYLVDKTVHYFLMEYQSGDPKDHDWEVSDARFASEDEVKKIVTFKTEQEAFEKILQKFKQMK